jgi:hypothetical protein
MSNEEKKKAYLFYTEINDKTGIFFKYYTECSSTYSEEIFLMWFPMSLELFLDKFGV